MKPLVTPIIFCGAGANLYPLCDDGMASSSTAAAGNAASSSNAYVSSKALLPLANRPMLAFVLQNLFSAGLSHCLLLAPSHQYSAIQRALASIKLVAPPNLAFLTDNKRRPKEIKDHDRATQGTIHFVDAAAAPPTSFAQASAAAARSSGFPSQPMAGTSSSSGGPSGSGSMRVELLPLGPHDGTGGVNKVLSEEDRDRFRRGVALGTAELLRWVASLGKVESDPLILPVDLLAPTFPLRQLLDVYVQFDASHAEAPTACCALYERGAGDGVGREREREGPGRLISAYAPDSTAARLVFLRDEDISSDLEVRRALMETHPHTRISTRLLDAHVYIFNKEQILPLLEANTKLTSLRDHVLPLIAKASWMKGLAAKAGWPLDGAATAGEEDGDQDESDDMLRTTDDLMASDLHGVRLHEEAIARNSNGVHTRAEGKIRCLSVVVRLDQQAASTGANALPAVTANEAAVPRFVARANTVATYLECNRWLLKAMAANASEGPVGFSIPEIVEGSIAATNASLIGGEQGANANATSTTTIAPSAQISNDSIMGLHARIGERASVKRSTIGHNCDIGRNARLAGCILMDDVQIGENVKLENVICCRGSTIGDRCTLKDCDVAADVRVAPDTNVKNEKLAADRGMATATSTTSGEEHGSHDD